MILTNVLILTPATPCQNIDPFDPPGDHDPNPYREHGVPSIANKPLLC